MSRAGTLAAAGGCRSLGRFGASGSQNHYAARHTFTMAAAGWVTIDLENAGRGRDRIDAYVVLINGADPAGGIVLKRNDDSGRGSNSRIVRKWLAPRRYTIEATTFSRRDAGSYRLTVTADYRPRITGPATGLRVENGDTVTLRWSYRPRSARVSIAWVDPPDGLDVRIVANDGDVTLTAAASCTATYTVHVAFSNGGTTRTGTASVTSYCPTGQVELPSDCARPLTALRRGADVIVRNPPNGYAPDSGCHETWLTQTRSHLWCRRVQDARTYILRSDLRIVETGDRIVNSLGHDLGRILMIKPDGWTEGDPLEALEGCQPVTAEHWQCDYYSDQMFHAELEHDAWSYVMPALRKGVLDPAGKLGLCGAFYLRARLTPSPQASAAAIGVCSAAVVPPNS
ncbi:MAG: hypothetical protein OXF61_13045 [Acidimicrobiaceae bacterium]|nr:hypothetical protein [Acidimicrobiaceae bacterium]